MFYLKNLLQNEVPDPEAGGAAGGSPATPEPAPEPQPTGDPAPAPEGTPSEDPTPAWTQSAPEDWRQQIAGEDDKRLKQLERFTDVNKFIESAFNAQDKIRAGEISNGLPDDPSDEQLAAYRDANGIPSTAEDYAMSLDEGLVLGEMDERIMGDVYKVAHENNVSNDVMSQLTNAMLKGREHEQQALTQQDGLDKQTADRQLRDAWGQDFETNHGLVRNLINGLPETIRDDFASARLADGTAVFNSPEMLNFFAEAMRAINPAATVVPAGNGNPTQAISSRIAELEGQMGTDSWYKDEASQKELRDLYDAQERMTK